MFEREIMKKISSLVFYFGLLATILLGTGCGMIHGGYGYYYSHETPYYYEDPYFYYETVPGYPRYCYPPAYHHHHRGW